MNLRYPVTVILLALMCVSCHQRKDTPLNYWDQGFLDDNTFQLVFTVEADDSAIGLVKRRASAEKEASLQLQERLIDSLAEYIIKNRSSFLGSSGKDKPLSKQKINLLKEELEPLAHHGKNIMQYYNENDSIVIVHRIIKNNLKTIITDIIRELTAGVK